MSGEGGGVIDIGILTVLTSSLLGVVSDVFAFLGVWGRVGGAE